MDYVNYLLVAIGVFLLFQRFIPTKGVKQITTADLKKELGSKDKQFVDVRTPGEYKLRNIKGFINLPLHQLNQQALKKLDKSKEVVVICQSGMRSSKASKTLKKLGFEKVTNVKGGMSAW